MLAVEYHAWYITVIFQCCFWWNHFTSNTKTSTPERWTPLFVFKYDAGVFYMLWWPAISKDSLPCVQRYDTHTFIPCASSLVHSILPVPHWRGSCFWWMDCVACSFRLGFSTSRGREDPSLVRAKKEKKDRRKWGRESERDMNLDYPGVLSPPSPASERH